MKVNKIVCVVAVVLIAAASFLAGHFHGVAQQPAQPAALQASVEPTHAPELKTPEETPETHRTPETSAEARLPGSNRPASPVDTSDTIQAQNLVYTGPFAWITGPLTDLCDEHEIRYLDDCSEIMRSVLTGEIKLDRNRCPYYLSRSCIYGREDEIMRYYLSRSPVEQLEIQTDESGTEFIIDHYGERHEVRQDILHPELRFFYREERYVVREGDTLMNILDNQTRWYSDFRGQEAVDEYLKAHPEVDPDNLTPGQVLRGGLEEIYLVNTDGNLSF